MDRRSALAIALVAFVSLIGASAAAQSPPGKIPPPEGWVQIDAPGRLAAIKHPATLAHAEAARLQVSAEELPAWRADVIDRLGRAGLNLVDDPLPIDLAGTKAFRSTLSANILDRDFTLLIIEVHNGTQLLCITALLRPDDDNPVDRLEADVLAFAAAAAR